MEMAWYGPAMAMLVLHVPQGRMLPCSHCHSKYLKRSTFMTHTYTHTHTHATDTNETIHT